MKNPTHNWTRGGAVWLRSCLGLGLVLSGCADDVDVLSSSVRGGPVPGCDIDTGFAGDSLCIGEPAADEPFLWVHYGPDDYDDMEDVDRFVLTPQAYEETNCQKRETPNTEDVYTMGYYLTARSGTHHIIVYGGDTSFSRVPNGSIPTGEQRGADLSFLVGAQSGIGAEGIRLDTRSKPNQLGGSEYEGWATLVPANKPICYEAHYINVTDEPLLRESWTRWSTIPEDKVDVLVEPMFWLGGLSMAVPPGAHEVVKGKCQLPPNEHRVRLMGFTGHMHAAGVRQTVWKKDLEGNREKVYETFSWEEPMNAEFNLDHVNDPINTEAGTDGAVSGPLWVEPGETLEWECEYMNTTNGTLNFGNGAYDAEMCNVFGFYGPSFGTGPWRCFNF